jgi:hypothetical protein
MNCYEVRQQFSVHPRGGTTLTEQALAHAHVTQCRDCQAKRVSVPLALSARPSVEPPPVPLVIPTRAMLTSRSPIASTRAVVSSARAVAGLLERAGFAGVRAARRLTRLGSAVLIVCHGTARAVGEAVGAVLGLLSRSLRETGRGVGRVVVPCWLGALRTRDVLVRVGVGLSSLVASSARAVGHLVGTIPGLVARARLASARSARRLTRLGTAVMMTCHEATRAAGRLLATCWLGALRTRDVVGRAGERVPALVAASARAVGHLVGTIPGLVARARFACARSARGLTRFGAAAMMACYGAARAVGAAAGAVLGLVWRSLGETVRAAGRVVAMCRLGAMQSRDGLRRIGRGWASLVAPSAWPVGPIVGAARAHPRVCAGIMSGIGLVASLLFLDPRLRPDDLFSTEERLVTDARLPVDRKPAEPSSAPPLAIQVAPPRPAPGPQPVRAPRVPAPETHAPIPPPERRSAAVAAEARPTAEASDPGAAIDWLLQGSPPGGAENP